VKRIQLFDEHILEAIGRSRIVVQDGRVVTVSPPLITDCPLAKRFAFPVDEMTDEAVRKNIENRIASFGMCTRNRDIYDDTDFVGFGASELISNGILSGILDCAIIACDGAGTVIVTDPRMVQGIGGRMSGLVKTTPYSEVVMKIECGGGRVLDQKTGLLDPAAGVHLAKKWGYTRPAVTVATAHDAEAVRRTASDVLIIGVHTTGISKEDAVVMNSTCDIITGCASSQVRDISAKDACLQAGTTVPVFAMTKEGKRLIIQRITDITYPLMITRATLPVSGEKVPHPLI